MIIGVLLGTFTAVHMPMSTQLKIGSSKKLLLTKLLVETLLLNRRETIMWIGDVTYMTNDLLILG